MHSWSPWLQHPCPAQVGLPRLVAREGLNSTPLSSPTPSFGSSLKRRGAQEAQLPHEGTQSGSLTAILGSPRGAPSLQELVGHLLLPAPCAPGSPRLSPCPDGFLTRAEAAPAHRRATEETVGRPALPSPLPPALQAPRPTANGDGKWRHHTEPGPATPSPPGKGGCSLKERRPRRLGVNGLP